MVSLLYNVPSSWRSVTDPISSRGTTSLAPSSPVSHLSTYTPLKTERHENFSVARMKKLSTRHVTDFLNKYEPVPRESGKFFFFFLLEKLSACLFLPKDTDTSLAVARCNL